MAEPKIRIDHKIVSHNAMAPKFDKRGCEYAIRGDAKEINTKKLPDFKLTSKERKVYHFMLSESRPLAPIYISMMLLMSLDETERLLGLLAKKKYVEKKGSGEYDVYKGWKMP